MQPFDSTSSQESVRISGWLRVQSRHATPRRYEISYVPHHHLIVLVDCIILVSSCRVFFLFLCSKPKKDPQLPLCRVYCCLCLLILRCKCIIISKSLPSFPFPPPFLFFLFSSRRGPWKHRKDAWEHAARWTLDQVRLLTGYGMEQHLSPSHLCRAHLLDDWRQWVPCCGDAGLHCNMSEM